MVKSNFFLDLTIFKIEIFGLSLFFEMETKLIPITFISEGNRSLPGSGTTSPERITEIGLKIVF